MAQQVRADANHRLYRLRPADLLELDAWLDPYRKLWSERLDALEHHLDNNPEPIDQRKDSTQ